MGFLLSGELDYFLDENKVHLKKGEGIFINSNTLHMAKPACPEKDVIMAVVCFQPEIFTQSKYTPLYVKYFQHIIDKDFSGCKIDPAVQSGASVITAMKELYELWQKDNNYELLCLSALCRTWHYTLECLSNNEEKLVAKVSSKYESELKCMISYIQSHYPENISIDDIASHANISRSECFRCFKRLTAKSPVTYINEYRLSCAANLLTSTYDAVTVICTKCGFSSSSYFGKLFRKAYGVSPLVYRSKHSSKKTE